MTQGTCNGGDRGNVRDRRRRREWLVETYRADVDAWAPRGWTVADWESPLGIDGPTREAPVGEGEPACRCYRCGRLLTVDTVSPDRIVPGCIGGTYRRNNIRPACLPCQSITGNEIKRALRRSS